MASVLGKLAVVQVWFVLRNSTEHESPQLGHGQPGVVGVWGGGEGEKRKEIGNSRERYPCGAAGLRQKKRKLSNKGLCTIDQEI